MADQRHGPSARRVGHPSPGSADRRAALRPHRHRDGRSPGADRARGHVHRLDDHADDRRAVHLPQLYHDTPCRPQARRRRQARSHSRRYRRHLVGAGSGCSSRADRAAVRPGAHDGVHPRPERCPTGLSLYRDQHLGAARHAHRARRRRPAPRTPGHPHAAGCRGWRRARQRLGELGFHLSARDGDRRLCPRHSNQPDPDGSRLCGGGHASSPRVPGRRSSPHR